MENATATDRMHVNIDRDRCCGYTVCADICPEVYKIDEQGFAYVEQEEVPPELQETAREGAECCPELAILINGVEP